jgi:tellurite resistance protein
MNNTGRNSEKSGYLVIMLLVVGLTAFSHSMKELTEIHQLTLDASRLVAQWSGNVTPAELPQIPQVAQTVVRIEKHESCESKESAQAVERKIQRAERPVEVAKLKKPRRVDIDADAFEVRVPTVQIPDSDEFPAFTFKTKTRKPGAFRINPRDREMLLKTLNRSINLRIAS